MRRRWRWNWDVDTEDAAWYLFAVGATWAVIGMFATMIVSFAANKGEIDRMPTLAFAYAWGAGVALAMLVALVWAIIYWVPRLLRALRRMGLPLQRVTESVEDMRRHYKET